MKKKIVLLSTIAFAGLAGATASTTHASDDFKVSIVRDDTKVYRKANLTKAFKVDRDTVYEVEGTRKIKGAKYYRVSQGSDRTVGYVKANQTKKLKYTHMRNDEDVHATKSSTIWKNIYRTSKRGTLKKGREYEVRGYYTLASGKRYYSIEDERTERWLGYVHQNSIRFDEHDELRTAKYKVSISANSAKVYKDASLKKEVKKAKKDTIFDVNGYRTIKGSKYYRVYQNGKYVGYVKASQTKKVNYRKADFEVRPKRTTTVYADVYRTKSLGKIYKNHEYDVEGVYTLASGKKVYEIEYRSRKGKVAFVDASAVRVWDDDDDYYDDDRYDDDYDDHYDHDDDRYDHDDDRYDRYDD